MPFFVLIQKSGLSLQKQTRMQSDYLITETECKYLVTNPQITGSFKNTCTTYYIIFPTE